MCVHVRSPLPVARHLRWREESQALLCVSVVARDPTGNEHVPREVARVGCSRQWQPAGVRLDLVRRRHPVLTVRHVPTHIPHLPGIHQPNDLGMPQLGQDQLSKAVASSPWLTIQHRHQKEPHVLLLL